MNEITGHHTVRQTRGDERTTPGGLLLPVGVSYETSTPATGAPVPTSECTPVALQPSPANQARIAEYVVRALLAQAGGMAGRLGLAAGSGPRPFSMQSVPEFATKAAAWIVRKTGADRKSKKTAAARRDGLSAFLRYFDATGAGGTFVGGDPELQAKAIVGFVEWLRKQTNHRGDALSARTVNGYFRSVRVVVQGLAEDAGAFNPFFGIPAPKPGIPDHPRLPPSMVQTLLEAVDNYPWRSELERSRNAVLIRLYVVAGMRLEEVVLLENGDVNLDTGAVHIRHGKGTNGGRSRFAQCPTFVGELRRYMQAKERAGRTETKRFMVSIRQKGGIGTKTVRRVFDKLEPHVGQHVMAIMFRRTAIDLMRISGMQNEVICRQVGNSVAMTSYYSQVSDEEQRLATMLINPQAVRARLTLPSSGNQADGTDAASSLE